jgi:hypothetical protein
MTIATNVWSSEAPAPAHTLEDAAMFSKFYTPPTIRPLDILAVHAVADHSNGSVEMDLDTSPNTPSSLFGAAVTSTSFLPPPEGTTNVKHRILRRAPRQRLKTSDMTKDCGALPTAKQREVQECFLVYMTKLALARMEERQRVSQLSIERFAEEFGDVEWWTAPLPAF